LATAAVTSLPAGVATRAEEADVDTESKPIGSFAGFAAPEAGWTALNGPALMPADALTAEFLAGRIIGLLAAFAGVIANGNCKSRTAIARTMPVASNAIPAGKLLGGYGTQRANG
jgi:hypothetical protein